MPKTNKDTQLGELIKAARKSADYTLVELSERIGISNQALSSIERGLKNPSRQTLMNLARVLHDSFNINWLEKVTEESSQQSKVVQDELLRRGTKDEFQEAFNEFLEFKFGTDSVAIKEVAEGARLIPLRSRIIDGQAMEEPNADQKIFIPARMTRPGKSPFGVLVQDDSLNDAMVGPGDVLIANHDTSLASGKFALIEIEGRIRLKRITLKGASVTLLSANDENQPLKISRRQLICLCEVTGLLRFLE